MKRSSMGVRDEVDVPPAKIPCPPTYLLASDAKSLLPDTVFTEHSEKLEQFEKVREKLYHRNQDVTREAKLLTQEIIRGQKEAAATRIKNLYDGESVSEILSALQDPIDKHEAYFHGGGASLAEHFVMAIVVESFFKEGVLTPDMPDCVKLGFEEVDMERFLLGVNQALKFIERYVVLRGEQLDLASIAYSLSVIEAWNHLLMQFDFRNSDLRRSYDRVKWNLKKLEEVNHEVLMARARTGVEEAPAELPSSTSASINLDKLEVLLEQYKAFDELRESVIKGCRDPQKASKNAIVAFHAGKTDKGTDLLEKAVKDLNKVNGELPKGPSLRSGGSFTSAVEEYVEAFCMSFLQTEKRLPTISEIESKAGLDFKLRLGEYIGGLGDTCGEIMRQAVRASGKQDQEFVLFCLSAISTIHSGVMSMTRLPSGMGKKVKAMNDHLEKVENLIYEMALIRAGKSKLAPAIDSEKPEE